MNEVMRVGDIIYVTQFSPYGDHFSRKELFLNKFYRVISIGYFYQLQFCKIQDERAVGAYATNTHTWAWSHITKWVHLI